MPNFSHRGCARCEVTMEKSRPSLRRKEDAACEAYGPFRPRRRKRRRKKRKIHVADRHNPDTAAGNLSMLAKREARCGRVSARCGESATRRWAQPWGGGGGGARGGGGAGRLDTPSARRTRRGDGGGPAAGSATWAASKEESRATPGTAGAVTTIEEEEYGCVARTLRATGGAMVRSTGADVARTA